uniref:Uncharacterized protein n=1 Tax=Minutocellus polymorphus TaxID=265543 RepID=A0A7S0FJA3_9STRA|eukprot:CAMPEP_0197725736 /NCGR_PEP_ID=MMETSP1434-20131217/10184_1 /TAXON_ID=265543 /ORGANISM="Minutocellus polymorphus, Strain CCMP3303" /LENGTH=98 /DNA_ID=CAMNT_0043311371 /DNA_START=44 /DNA_END=340 /DNA_ORIENTATION=-
MPGVPSSFNMGGDEEVYDAASEVASTMMPWVTISVVCLGISALLFTTRFSLAIQPEPHHNDVSDDATETETDADDKALDDIQIRVLDLSDEFDLESTT